MSKDAKYPIEPSIEKLLDIPFKEFMPGQIIQSSQFNDDMLDIEDKVNEIITKHNGVDIRLSEHQRNLLNPHCVTAEQINAYEVEDVDALIDDVKNGNLNDEAITNRVLADACVDNRVLVDGAVTLSKLDTNIGNQIDISNNMSIKERYTKLETDAIIQEKVGDGTYSKEQIDAKFEEYQAGTIVDGTIDVAKLKDSVGRQLDIEHNPSISNRYTKSEVNTLIAKNGLPKDWGNLSDEVDDEIVTQSGLGALPISDVMVCGEFKATETDVLNIKVQDVEFAKGEFNTLEERLDSVDDKLNVLDSKADKSSIPTKVSQLENDRGYLTEHQDLSHLATESYVKNEIAKAQLGGGDVEIDLSEYATKDELNNKADKSSIPTRVSQLENDSNFLTSVPSEYITEDELNNILKNNSNGSTFKLSDFTVSNGDVIRQSGDTYYIDVLATQGHLVRCNLNSSRTSFSFKAERGMYWLTLGSDTSNTYSTIVAIGDAQPGKIVVMNNSSGSILKVIRNQSNSHVNAGASYSVGSTVKLQLTDSKLIITINNIIYMEVPFSLMSGDNAQYIATKYIGFYLNISGAEVHNNNPTIFLSNPSYGEAGSVDLSNYVTKSELNALIAQINALRSDVDRLLQNNGGAGGSEKLYYNPTITIENNRAVFREDGYEERFLITHVENKNDPNYRGSVQVRGSDGYDYYVLLTDNAQSTNSKFRYNNLIPSHGGWMSLQNKANAEYVFNPDRTYPYRNGFNFTDTVENVDGSVNSEVLNLALEHLNTSFPAVNMQVATSSKNKIRQQSVQDPWWGAHYGYPGYFDIIINERPIKSYAGAYGAGNYEYSDRGCWIHTVLHELGHTFGLKDQPKHDPSLFNYDAPYSQLAGELFMQPNDLCALSYFYKKHYNLDITPETTQEDINKQLAQNAQVLTLANELDTCEVEDGDTIIDFMYPAYDTTDMKVKTSDVVVRCKLKFDKEEKIQITKDELNNLSLRYNVFTIEPLETFKGELVNNKLKIHISENINIDENAEYLAYLVNYEDVPCSLINPGQGLEKLS